MEQEFTKDYFWEVYKQLPEDLKEALFSDKNNEVVSHICAQAGLSEEQLAIVAKFIGRVIMGLLPLDEFPVTIELELNISQDLTSQITRQIYISIFKHLRVSLNKINNANSGYSDAFTSNSDGVLEKKEREAEQSKPKTIPQTFKQEPVTPRINPINPINLSPPPKKFIPSDNQEMPEFSTKDINLPSSNPTTSFSPPPPETPKIPITPKEAPISTPSTPTLPESPIFENPSTSVPSRDAFKKSLENFNFPLPEVNTSKNNAPQEAPPSIPNIPKFNSSPEKIDSNEPEDPYKEMAL